MSMITAGSSSSVYLLPGMSVKLTANFFFAKSGSVMHKYQDGSTKAVTLLHGFVLDDTTVGEIVAGDGADVVYKHKKFELNVITFYAVTGEKGRVDVMSVPIHDHSSIVAGGPAYGTYFVDDETVTTDNSGEAAEGSGADEGGDDTGSL